MGGRTGSKIPLFVLLFTFWFSVAAGILRNYINFFTISAVCFIYAHL